MIMVSPVKPLIALWRKPRTRTTVLFGTVSMLGLGLGVAWGSWTRACAGNACPSIAALEDYTPVQSVKFYAADGRLITDLGERRTVLPLAEMSPAIPAAFLAIEDKRFYQHNGIDYVRFLGALRRVILARRYAEGFSTITMQLPRNIFDRVSRKKTIRRKIREVLMALEIERTFSKDRILELYLNQIYLGGGANGVEEAAQRYFGKSSSQVNVAEAAMLAALPLRPAAYDPRRHPDAAVRRRNVVLNLMRDQEFLTSEEAERWKAYPLQVNTRGDYEGVAEYFVEWVRQQLYARLGSNLYTEGYRVYTTLDLDMQIAAERALEDQLQVIESGNLRPDLPHRDFPHQTYQDYLDSLEGPPPLVETTPYLQGAFIALDAETGSVWAMVGGRNFRESRFNRATQAARQPGSTFKPFVYASAIRADRPPSHIIVDGPISIMQNDSMPWEPRNFEDDYRGPMTLRRGLRQSRNLVAIRLGQELGVSTVKGEALRFGLSTRIPDVPSIFIGSASVLPLEMVSAYTAFANLGVHTAPLGVLRVEDVEGNIVWQPQVRRDEVMDPEHMWLLTNMLEDVANRGTAYTAVRAIGKVPYDIPVGGKTGTTNDGTDVWFIGFTPELVAGVWIGFDEPQKIMANSAGGLLAAPAWANFINEVYSRRPRPEGWQRPANLVTREVDNTTGYLATPFCPRAETHWEWFIPGTEPREYCPVHSRFWGLSSVR
jgi:penicillin-binding protein 1A